MASATLSPVERALKDSLNPETFRDVNLYAFSRRTALQDGSIIIDHPLPIVAIGSILKETEHFSKLLTSGFSEANPDAAGPIRQSAHPYEYDYDTDSDLEDFEEPASTLSPGAESSPTSASSTRGKAKTETADEEKPVTKQEDGATGASKRHQVLIPNVAYRTLKACVLYLYTGKITFLPFKSKRADRSFALLTLSDSAPLACSPKSAYRLAESYGITALQDLAYKEIVSRLNPENIVEETFSSFFGRYDRLREDAVSFMSQHYTDSAVQQSLPDIIDKIVIGDMPYAGGLSNLDYVLPSSEIFGLGGGLLKHLKYGT
ncbi:hypothetical protein L226DRAFT_614035 [Lentinus tigrinus ALCF2SS1-7]|uniref:uncharacterized protein n=1 Tax=Lentinus tigrinus ALCF2SS1-7 TaxID=1328758 RepID=UPI00116636CA|nr:hypothetical protein L226DRAFT_614035 [Lentinus tigrinus ALCF2SS1-7]